MHKLFALAVALTFIASCSDSDSNNANNENNVNNSNNANNGNNVNNSNNANNENNANNSNNANNQNNANNSNNANNQNNTNGAPWLPEFVGVNSSWETALGNGDDAILDTSGSDWERTAGTNQDLLTVVTASDEGIPSIDGNNVMRMGVNGEANRMLLEETAFSLEGDCRYSRMYQHVVCINDDVGQIHHFEDFPELGPASTRFIHKMSDYRAASGTWSVQSTSYTDQSTSFAACPNQDTYRAHNLLDFQGNLTLSEPPGNSSDNLGSNLECGKWYRIESQECCAPGAEGCWNNEDSDAPIPIHIKLRVYDEDGQVFGDDDLYTSDVAGVFTPGNMMEAYEDGGCWIVESAEELGLGNNGQQGVTAVAPALMYWDAVVTGSSNDRREGQNPWIGPCQAAGCF